MSSTSRGRSQDRKRVAGGQDYEVRYEAKKSGSSKQRVKRAVKKSATAAARSNANCGVSLMPRKRVQFEPEDYVALDQLARERRVTFQQLAQEAFNGLLQKHHRPTDLKEALGESAGHAHRGRSRKKRSTRH